MPDKIDFQPIDFQEETARVPEAFRPSGPTRHAPGPPARFAGPPGPTSLRGDTTAARVGRLVLNALPTIGATAGGLLGGGPVSPSTAIPLAAVGGAGGEAGRQLIARGLSGKPSTSTPAPLTGLGGGGVEAMRRLIERLRSGEGPATSTEAGGRILGQAAIGAGSEALGPLVKGGGNLLKASAERQMARVLGPVGRPDKGLTTQLVPELLARRVQAGTRAGLESKAAAQAQSAGGLLSSMERAALSETVDKVPIQQALTKAKSKMFVAGSPGVVKNPQALKTLEALEKSVGNLSPTRESFRDFRQFLDYEVSAAKGFGVALESKTTARLQKLTAGAIARELNRARPDIARLNHEFSFWDNVRKIVHEANTRTQSQSMSLPVMLGRAGLGAVGVGAGYAGGSPESGIAMGAFGLLAPKLLTSTAWRTMAAVNKARVAELLAKGQTQQAAILAARLTGIAATPE